MDVEMYLDSKPSLSNEDLVREKIAKKLSKLTEVSEWDFIRLLPRDALTLGSVREKILTKPIVNKGDNFEEN